MPHDYNYADSYIDPFAQTVSTDDLFFDDDFTPVAEPVVEQNPVGILPPEPVPDEAPPPTVGLGQSQHAQNIPRGSANGERGRGRGRGRVRGRGRGGNHDANTQIHEPKTREPVKDVRLEEVAPETSIPTDATMTPATPSGPKDTTKTPHSVRGDRTLTGGTPRTRLTEAELSAKLANMRSKNESLQLAHARAEADAQKYEAREAMLAQKDMEKKKESKEKQKRERQDRQQMMGEREKNRQRKLDAQGGREWDFEKEEGFSGTGEERRRGAARGAHGGIAPSPRPAPTADVRQEEDGIPTTFDSGRGRGRGRGGRGPRGGRGGRGDHAAPSKQPSTQVPPTASDFPELPATTNPTGSVKPASNGPPKKLDFPNKPKTTEAKATEPPPTETKAIETEKPVAKKVSDIKTDAADRPAMKKVESFGLSPLGPGGSWADQVDDS